MAGRLNLDAGRALIAERRQKIAAVRAMLESGEIAHQPVRVLFASLAEAVVMMETMADEHEGLLDLLEGDARTATARH